MAPEHPPITDQITFLYTRNMARSASFYEDVMGLALTLDQGGCRIYRITGDAYLGICQRDDAPIQPADPGERNVIFTIVTDDVDGWYQHLASTGAAVEKPPAENPDYRIYHFFVRDPNGYLIEIQRFLDPDWAGTA